MKILSTIFVLISIIAAAGCRVSQNANATLPANTPNTARTDTSPATAANATQKVTIESPDKVILAGTFFPSEKPNSPALLLLHQWQNDRHSYDDFAKRMQAKAFSVLSIDGRGFGESTKKADSSAVSAGRTDADVKAMLGDVGAAFDFLARQKNVDPAKIGIVGASYGSSLALIYTADDPNVAAVALLSPGINYFGNMATEPAIKRFGDRPILLVAAEDDEESADSVRKLAAAVNNPKYSEKIYPAGGHGTGLFRAKVGLEDLLEQFFIKSL